MLCQVCKKNPAKVHLTWVVDEKSRTLSFCVARAKKKGVSDPAGFSLDDLLLLALGASQEPKRPARTAHRRRGPNSGQDPSPGATA